MAFGTCIPIVGVEFALGLMYGLGAAAIALPLSLCFFFLSIWFVQVWHYAATGMKWPDSPEQTS